MSGGGQDYYEPGGLPDAKLNRGAEQMTVDAVQVGRQLCAGYAIPEDCLLCRVPPILKVVDDHVFFPFAREWPFRRWIRVSNLEVLKRECFQLRDILCDKTVMIYVMPYISSSDAYSIHQLITNPGKIQLHSGIREEQDIADEEDKLMNNPSASSIQIGGIGTLEGHGLPVQGRYGVLKVYDPDHLMDESHAIQLSFMVINYGLLWGKSREHIRCIDAASQAKELLDQITSHKQRITENTSLCNTLLSEDYMLKLEETCEKRKQDLVLSLYTHDIDPHNAILAIDAEEHENLYDIGYDPCYPNERTDHDNMESTKKAIEMYMHMLENSGRSVLPAAEARWKVLESEAVHEIEFHRSNAIRQFSSELDMCADKLALILEKMKLAVTRPSLIGVIGYGQVMM